jgi:Uma2 family endonuclease
MAKGPDERHSTGGRSARSSHSAIPAGRRYNRRMASPEEMQPAPTLAPKFTYEDYVNFPDDGRRHELIDGDHYVSPAPFVRHQEISRRVSDEFAFHLRDHSLGKLYYAPVDVILSNVDVVQPDLLFISNERTAILQNQVRGAPDLVIEILSPSTRKVDEAVKRRLYDRVGVREYWIVDDEIETVKVHRRAEDGSFPKVAELSSESNDSLSTPLLPDFLVRLDELFRP